MVIVLFHFDFFNDWLHNDRYVPGMDLLAVFERSLHFCCDFLLAENHKCPWRLGVGRIWLLALQRRR